MDDVKIRHRERAEYILAKYLKDENILCDYNEYNRLRDIPNKATFILNASIDKETGKSEFHLLDSWYTEGQEQLHDSMKNVLIYQKILNKLTALKTLKKCPTWIMIPWTEKSDD
tara:strand:- start:162 stop:503 length:342 start_codon:yes stop_codon:yes gene_type:complete